MAGGEDESPVRRDRRKDRDDMPRRFLDSNKTRSMSDEEALRGTSGYRHGKEGVGELENSRSGLKLEDERWGGGYEGRKERRSEKKDQSRAKGLIEKEKRDVSSRYCEVSIDRILDVEREGKETIQTFDDKKRDVEHRDVRSPVRQDEESEDEDSEKELKTKGRKRQNHGKKKDLKKTRSSHGRMKEEENDSDSSSSQDSEASDTDEDLRREQKRRRKRKRRKEKEERELEKEVRRKRKEKKKKLREKRVEDDRKEKKKKEKEMRAKLPITTSWGKYGLLKEIDMWNKRPEFSAWLAEVKKVNLETLASWEEKLMFKEYMEDFNTATFPSKKYYNMDIYHRRKIMKDRMKGLKHLQNIERTDFNDEEQRRQELRKEREQQKEAEVENLKRSMQSGMAQAMREQAQLREEMQYQFRLGNFEAGQAIQRRLDPDAPGAAFTRDRS